MRASRKFLFSGFLVAALSLALAIGANTSIFSVAKQVLYEGAASSLEDAMERESRAISAAAAMADGREGIAAFVGKALAASGDTRRVVADPQARYYGAALDDLGLRPRGANPRIGPTRFESWLNRSAARV